MLRTRLTERLGIQYPLMSAPMSGHSGGTLAAAVSKAGGLGSFGAMNPAGPEWVREQIRLIRSETDRPFAVGFITAFLPMIADNFAATLDERAPVVAFSFGDPGPWAARAKEAGATVMCQVQTMEDARLAAAAGTDMLVAQGTEAGGHTGYLSLLPFLSRVVSEFPDVPVLAAGGIGDGRTLAAALAAGADGAWAGTAFLASPETIEVPEIYKQRVRASDGADTVHTRVFDIVEGLPWPEGIGGRVYRNRFVAEWEGRDEELVAHREELRGVLQQAYHHDTDVAAVYMGQSAAFVGAARPAGEIVRSLCEDAERCLRERWSKLLH